MGDGEALSFMHLSHAGLFSMDAPRRWPRLSEKGGDSRGLPLPGLGGKIRQRSAPHTDRVTDVQSTGHDAVTDTGRYAAACEAQALDPPNRLRLAGERFCHARAWGRSVVQGASRASGPGLRPTYEAGERKCASMEREHANPWGLVPDRARLRAHGKRMGWCRSWYGV